MKNETLRNFLIAVGCIVVVAGLGTLFVLLGNNWFNDLIKPTQWIPNFVIPIVWTIIYITAGVVLYFWIKDEVALEKQTIILYAINGALNILWCLMFFTLHLMLLGLIIIVINAFFAYLLLINIKEQKPLYSKIMLIYPIWLSIAMFLNTAIWLLN